MIHDQLAFAVIHTIDDNELHRLVEVMLEDFESRWGGDGSEGQVYTLNLI